LQKSIDIVAEVYRIASNLPPNEQYGLTFQLGRAVVSVPANIAERFGRWRSNEFVRFLIGTKLALLSPAGTNPALQMASEISKMIFPLQDKLSRRK
jgi:four helix bundle protein